MADAGMEEEYNPHPFTSYNKDKDATTLVGNWVEEQALKGMTGTTRYESWVDKSPQAQQTIYATKQDNSSEMPTHPRVIEHSNQLHAKDWASVTHVSYEDPQQRRLLLNYANVHKLGPRERMEMEAMMREAADLPDEVTWTLQGAPVPFDPLSTQRDSFRGHDTTGIKVGQRVMKDPDGRPTKRDPTFLAETQIVQKQLADRVFKEEATKQGALDTTLLPNPDVPITIYSESVATGKFTHAFQGTHTLGKAEAPFNKYTNFTKPMSEYNKVVIDE